MFLDQYYHKVVDFLLYMMKTGNLNNAGSFKWNQYIMF